ncbi:glycoside hydrolase family 15 protein [Natrialbaceae archaeon AArc-T1-2]|uniref:glycoside hydrolase family 15 protein n=1 Tax=Natrialbaceae archaeon AArc-T1-2 TaxID=3053904 RepID=UPI00255AF4D3|nr:glycoside hydrolase family 15 protein [Natrialbaceae archaeon AArc-T1-2]WIV66786.1 glycoside hydrolase family 15 protein [Natrialbaceae archaeon AArc-T1-2]
MESEYPPIADYGAIGNDNRCALVSREGSIDWCPFPHLESPSVFSAILDADDGGRFAVSPDEPFEATQTYVNRTNVLETTFETDVGTATVTDFMPVTDGGPRYEGFQRSLFRTLECESGSVDLEVVLEPRFDYGRSETDLTLRDAEVVASGSGEPLHIHLHGVDDARIDGDRAKATVPLEAGESAWLCLQHGHSNHLSPDEREEILAETIAYWRDWLGRCEESAGELFAFDDKYGDVLRRSALVLKLLIHDGTGSIPAAPTTSLPEEIGGDLNWDYRYNWIRDAKFTVQALYNVGQREEAEEYFEWFRQIGHEEPADIQPIYGLHGETELEETTLDHLPGYRDSQPVRIGNAAADQEQLDIYGTIVQGIYETIRYENGLSDYDWESIRALADYVCANWDERDAGIWEFRDVRHHFVHSKLLCWVALDRAIQVGEEYDRDGPFERWADEREAIREAILERGYEESIDSFVQHFETDEALDATALLIPLYDFLPADDDRVQGTIDTVLEDLSTDDGLVYRFANSDARPKEPGAFLLCSFWLVDALVLSGRLEEAESIFETVLEHASPLGLLSEMVRPDGTLLGNYPQAFSHIGLLNSALYLASARDDVEEFPPEELAEGASAPLFRRHGSGS